MPRVNRIVHEMCYETVQVLLNILHQVSHKNYDNSNPAFEDIAYRSLSLRTLFLV